VAAQAGRGVGGEIEMIGLGIIALVIVGGIVVVVAYVMGGDDDSE